MFQYNDCLGSSLITSFFLLFFTSFNTTIVWVRPVYRKNKSLIYMFQYNDCLGSSYLALKILPVCQKFQYNDCLGSSSNISTDTGI